MPFKSKKQAAFLFSKKPEVAEEFADKTNDYDMPEETDEHEEQEKPVLFGKRGVHISIHFGKGK